MTTWISVEENPPSCGIDMWILPFEDEPGYSVNACAGCYFGEHGWRSVCGETIFPPPTHYAEIDWPEPPQETK